jgi:hypothetical protein
MRTLLSIALIVDTLPRFAVSFKTIYTFSPLINFIHQMLGNVLITWHLKI